MAINTETHVVKGQRIRDCMLFSPKQEVYGTHLFTKHRDLRGRMEESADDYKETVVPDTISNYTFKLTADKGSSQTKS